MPTMSPIMNTVPAFSPRLVIGGGPGRLPVRRGRRGGDGSAAFLPGCGRVRFHGQRRDDCAVCPGDPVQAERERDGEAGAPSMTPNRSRRWQVDAGAGGHGRAAERT